MPFAVQDGTEEALLFDICRYPNDDGLRLIYADYLEERGREVSLDRERAEFLRLQIEWDREFSTNCKAGVLGKDWQWRRSWLLDRKCILEKPISDYTREEVRALTGIQDGWFLDSWHFQRGLLGEIHLRLKHLKDFVAILFGHYPVAEVHVLDRCPERLAEDTWGWHACDAKSPWECRRPTDLPLVLYELLRRGVAHLIDHRTYDTRKLAWQDLSQACIRWARQQVFGPQEKQG